MSSPNMSSPNFPYTKSTLPTRHTLSARDLPALLAAYPKVLLAAPHQKSHRVSATELMQLDRRRYHDVPSSVASRRSADKPAGHLDLADLKDLMAWKLARGVWRPTLKSLVAQNEGKTVADTTAEAFALLHARDQEAAFAGDAVDVLCRLKGVGPATASLLLSVAAPERAPFFSDEIYYFIAAGDRAPHKIKYNLAELALVDGATQKARREVRDRQAKAENGREENGEIGDRNAPDGAVNGDADGPLVRADDFERAAYVIQKLQNPDVWEAAFGDNSESGEGAAEAIERIVEQKDGNKVETEATGFHRPRSRNAKEPAVSQEQREQMRKVKKEVIAATGGTIKRVGSAKRKADAGEQSDVKRTLRSSKRLRA